MELMTSQDASVHSTHEPGTPSVAVFFGGKNDSTDVGLVRVNLPAGTGMKSHRHTGSDVILTAVVGAVRVTKNDEVVDLVPGDALLIFKYESVSLSNPHDEPAELLVAAGPARFVSTIREWPE
jgi:quercetin dioxygenase-like cupin family protein